MSHKIFYESLEDHILKISLEKGLDLNLLAEIIIEQDIDSYKKSYGKTLIVGGANGYLGAVLISGLAALRSGSRYVEVFSTDTNHSLIPLRQPELMTSSDIKHLNHKFKTYKNLLLGPGISGDEWSREAFSIFKKFCQNKKTNKKDVVLKLLNKLVKKDVDALMSLKEKQDLDACEFKKTQFTAYIHKAIAELNKFKIKK